MKKQTLFLLLLLSSPLFIFGQSYRIEYLFTNKNGSEKKYFLETYKKASNFIELKYENLNEDFISQNDDEYFLIKNFKKKQINYTDRIFKKTLYVEDSLELFKWILTNDEKNILGYECKSAEVFFRGRKYKAYYTTDIKLRDGPWKFNGLPGLILEVESEHAEYKYIAQNIAKQKRKREKINILTKNQTFLNWNLYIEEFKKIIDNIIMKLIEDDNNMGGGIFKFEKPEIIYPKVQINDGFKY